MDKPMYDPQTVLGLMDKCKERHTLPQAFYNDPDIFQFDVSALLSLEKEIGGARWSTEANSFCHLLPDYCFMFSVFPIGPEETLVVSKWLVHRDALEGVDYDIEKLTETWTATNLQDRALAENNQRGVNGMGYIPGPYSQDAEDFVIRFADWYRQEARAATVSIRP
jgi:phenylpropionate dioxygenase-like ring-hydroxylating dioxygenase large terminal subunit